MTYDPKTKPQLSVPSRVTDSVQDAVEVRREQVSKDTAEFLAKGGKVQEIPSGVGLNEEEVKKIRARFIKQDANQAKRKKTIGETL